MILVIKLTLWLEHHFASIHLTHKANLNYVAFVFKSLFLYDTFSVERTMQIYMILSSFHLLDLHIYLCMLLMRLRHLRDLSVSLFSRFEAIKLDNFMTSIWQILFGFQSTNLSQMKLMKLYKKKPSIFTFSSMSAMALLTLNKYTPSYAL